MNDDEVRHLLRRAVDGLEPPPSLAGAALAQASRQRARRAVTVLAALIAVVAVSAGAVGLSGALGAGREELAAVPAPSEEATPSSSPEPEPTASPSESPSASASPEPSASPVPSESPAAPPSPSPSATDVAPPPSSPTPTQAAPAPPTAARSLQDYFDNFPNDDRPKWRENGEPAAELRILMHAGKQIEGECEFEDAVHLLKESPDVAPARYKEWIRDRHGVLGGDRRLQREFRSPATLPSDAKASGFETDLFELWLAPSDEDQYAYIVNKGDRGDVERWVRPMGQEGACGGDRAGSEPSPYPTGTQEASPSGGASHSGWLDNTGP